MHIIKKLLLEINSTLKENYNINIPEDDWELFKSPLTNSSGKIDFVRFRKRQDKSIEIIQKILDYHGKGEIVKYLSELVDIEPKIQTLQTNVRDHVVHAINTFLLGVYIIKKVGFLPSATTDDSYKFLWKLCGPTHDLGYPIEMANNIEYPVINKVNNMLERINSPSPKVISNNYPDKLNELCNGIDANVLIQKRITEWNLDINIENYYSWLRNKTKVDHGVISALTQLKIIDALYQCNNPNREEKEILKDGLNYNQKNFIYDIVSASTAIFIHNIDFDYPGFINKIKYDSAPLAFLIILCDTFQEWDRYSQKRDVFSGNDFNIECEQNNVSLYVPKKLEHKVKSTLSKRLTGLRVTVNNGIAVE